MVTILDGKSVLIQDTVKVYLRRVVFQPGSDGVVAQLNSKLCPSKGTLARLKMRSEGHNPGSVRTVIRHWDICWKCIQ